METTHFIEPKFLNPKIDIAFKKVFGCEENKQIVIEFLNDILELEDNEKIKNVEFLKTTLDPEIRGHKLSIVDVLVKDDKGIKYIIEMQSSKVKDFAERAKFYSSKVFTEQAHFGTKFSDLKRVVFIAICNFVEFKSKVDFISHHKMLDIKSGEVDLKSFSFTFIELPKFNKVNPGQLQNRLEKWAFFLLHAPRVSDEQVAVIVGNDAIIGQAFKALDKYSWNPNDLEIYMALEKYDRDQEAVFEQKAFEKACDIALSLLNAGMSVSDVQTHCQLDAKTINNLINKK